MKVLWSPNESSEGRAVSEIAYARVGDSYIAYRVTGDAGGIDVIMVAGALFPFEMLDEDRVASRFVSGLAALGRLVVFDKRGVGLSDPITDWTRSAQEQWAEDLCAVVEAAELDRPVVVSWEVYGVARLAVSKRPELFASMVLVNAAESTKPLADMMQTHGSDGVSTRTVEELVFPSRVDDGDFWDWLARAGRSGASPATAARVWSHMLGFEGSLTPDGLEMPTLVLHNHDIEAIDFGTHEVAGQIAGALIIDVPGADILPIAGDVDPLVTEIAQFVTGEASGLAPERLIAAVLFTDLVASTERAVTAGDQQWRGLLEIHDQAVRRSVLHQGGRVVKFTGDGVLALLPSATAAIETVDSIRKTLDQRVMTIRAGIHVGDIDVRGDDVSGISINVAARIMDRADADETLVSDAVCQATLGSGFRFDDAGQVELKGLPGQFTLHRIDRSD
jgi:class 3 adenylate cyclase